MHPKMAIGYMGSENGAIAIPLLTQLTVSDQKMIEKKCSMPLLDLRGQLYKCTIYETFFDTITRYEELGIRQ